MFMSDDEIAELEYGLYCAGSMPFIFVDPVYATNMCFSACRKGHLKAMYDMGARYFYGTETIVKNIDCAVYLWELAAMKGSARAQMALAFHYSRCK